MIANTVLVGAGGRLRRAALSQPPHFRRGSDASPAVDAAAQGAMRALNNSNNQRGDNYRSTGARPSYS